MVGGGPAIRRAFEASLPLDELRARWSSRSVRSSRYQLRDSKIGNSGVVANRRALEALAARHGGTVHEIVTHVSAYADHPSLAVDCPRCGASGSSSKLSVLDVLGSPVARDDPLLRGDMCQSGTGSSRKPCRPHLQRIYAHDPAQHPKVQKFPSLRIECPSCGVDKFAMCVSEGGGKKKATHEARVKAYAAELVRIENERKKAAAELGAAMSAVAAEGGGKRKRKAKP